MESGQGEIRNLVRRTWKHDHGLDFSISQEFIVDPCLQPCKNALSICYSICSDSDVAKNPWFPLPAVYQIAIKNIFSPIYNLTMIAFGGDWIYLRVSVWFVHVKFFFKLRHDGCLSMPDSSTKHGVST